MRTVVRHFTYFPSFFLNNSNYINTYHNGTHTHKYIYSIVVAHMFNFELNNYCFFVVVVEEKQQQKIEMKSLQKNKKIQNSNEMFANVFFSCFPY